MKSIVLHPIQPNQGVGLDTFTRPNYVTTESGYIHYSVPDGERLYISTGNCHINSVPPPERSIMIGRREAYIALSISARDISDSSISFWIFAYSNGKEIYRKSLKSTNGSIMTVVSSKDEVDFLKVAIRATGTGSLEKVSSWIFFRDDKISNLERAKNDLTNSNSQQIAILALHFCLYKKFLSCREGEKSELKRISASLANSFKETAKEVQDYRDISNGLDLEIKENAGDPLVLWNKLIARKAPYSDDLKIIAARRHLALGLYGRSLSTIKGIVPNLHSEYELSALEGDISKRKRLSLHSALLEFYTERVTDGVKVPFLLQSALEVAYPGKSEVLRQAFEMLAFGTSELASDENGYPDPAFSEIADEQPLCKSIVTCGFGWSGTGAVNDFLSGGKNIAFPFGKNEHAFFLGAPGMPGLRSVNHENFIDFLLNSVFRRDYRSILNYCMGREDYFNIFTSELNYLRAMILKAKKEGGVKDISETDLRTSLGVFFARTGSRIAKSGGKSIMLFNNLINASHLSCIDFLPNATGVIVRRDPRDQYVSQVLERRIGAPTVQSFIRGMLKQFDTFNAQMNALKDKSSCRVIFFEDFVLQEQTRLDLASSLSMVVSDSHTIFDPRVSIRNIGLWKTFHDQESIKNIERAMAEQLWHGSVN